MLTLVYLDCDYTQKQKDGTLTSVHKKQQEMIGNTKTEIKNERRSFWVDFFAVNRMTHQPSVCFGMKPSSECVRRQ